MIGTLLAVMGMFAMGCASDPGKEVREAKYNEAEANADRRENTAEAQRAQADKDAEIARKQREASAEHLAPASENRADVQAKVTEQRANYDAKATERLDKADAGIAEVKSKMKVAGARTPSEVRGKVDTAVTARDNVSKQLATLRGTSNDQWKSASEDLDKRFDELEGLVDQAKKSASKLK